MGGVLIYLAEGRIFQILGGGVLEFRNVGMGQESGIITCKKFGSPSGIFTLKKSGSG